MSRTWRVVHTRSGGNGYGNAKARRRFRRHGQTLETWTCSWNIRNLSGPDLTQVFNKP